MDNVLIIGTKKEASTAKKIVCTRGNCVDIVNSLANLQGTSLATPTNGYNLYYSSSTAQGQRPLNFSSIVNWGDGSISSLPISYNSSTSKWTSRYLENASIYNSGKPAPLSACITDLNAGTETNLFGATNWQFAPTIDSVSGSYYSWDSTNLVFNNSGPTGYPILITLCPQMFFSALPSDGHFIFRIRNGSTNAVIMEQYVYNAGGSNDFHKSLRFTKIASSVASLKFTVQYSGSPLTIYSFAMGSSNGTRLSIQEL